MDGSPCAIGCWSLLLRGAIGSFLDPRDGVEFRGRVVGYYRDTDRHVLFFVREASP